MSSEMIYQRNVYGNTLVELGKDNKNIVVLDADLSGSTRTAFFAKEFPDRFFNFGVAEQNMMGAAAGLASCGKTVFVSTFAMFATGRAWDQVRNSICYSRMDVKIVATHAGVTVGPDGATHQALEDIAIMRVIPNMTVIVPCDAPQTADAVKACLDIKGPVYIRLGRSKVPTVLGKGTFKLGKADLLKEGDDVSIFACGIMTKFAQDAADMLAKENINASVVNMHTIKPVDEDIIRKMVKQTKAMIICEEHSITGGLGCAVEEVVAECAAAIPVARIGVKNRFGQSGNEIDLLREYNLQAEDIFLTVKNMLKKLK